VPCVSEERKSKRARLEEEEYEPEEEDDIVESGEVAKGMFIMLSIERCNHSGLNKSMVVVKVEFCYYC